MDGWKEPILVKGGYNAYFIASAAMAVVGIIFAAIYGRLHKLDRAGASIDDTLAMEPV